MGQHQKWQGGPSASRPRRSPDMNGEYGMVDALCKPTGAGVDMDLYVSRGVGADDDGSVRSSKRGDSDADTEKDKGRGSYRCGRVSSMPRLCDVFRCSLYC
jgi:hypothetical protein